MAAGGEVRRGEACLCRTVERGAAQARVAVVKRHASGRRSPCRTHGCSKHNGLPDGRRVHWRRKDGACGGGLRVVKLRAGKNIVQAVVLHGWRDNLLTSTIGSSGYEHQSTGPACCPVP